MKMYVIGISDNKQSMDAVSRCQKSAKQFGHDVEHFTAITPKDDIYGMLKKRNISAMGFQEKYSRIDNCVAAFLSHYTLWMKCLESGELTFIFEHDAVFKQEIRMRQFRDICNYGKPSYGKFERPLRLGMNHLTSKRYLPGAHAYGVTPNGAKQLIEQASIHARPTDVFIHLDTFPTINELFPWPVECVDDFTTIQNKNGCVAKHRYEPETYKIIGA